MLSWTAAPETLGVDEAADLAGAVVRELGMDTILARVTAAEQYKKLDDLRYFTEAATGASWRDPDDLAWRDLRAEVAATLEVHENTAGAKLDMARRLVHDFPTTHSHLWSGTISDGHARALVSESTGLDSTLWAEYESRLLPEAEHLPLTRFRRLAAQVRASLEPEALIERHRAALEERRVWIEPAHDGMAYLSALLSAEDAIGASAAIAGIARGLKVEGETRTLSQIEADVFRDLLTDATGLVPPAESGAAPQPSPGARRGLQPEIFVHVPVMTVLCHTDDPARLVGYGPIDADTARVLCGAAPSFARVLTDPETGVILDYGRSTYRVPADLKRVLQVQDETCRFVGCTRPAALCDIDHAIPWSEDGKTVETNLAHLCRGHHRLKERGRWRIGRDPGGAVTWTSPTGMKYGTKPAEQGFAGAGSKVKAMTDWLAPPF